MPDTTKNYPQAWSRYVAQTSEPGNILPVELADNFGQLARWSARFRLAKSFKALDLGDGYANADTPQLYSAITRIFFVYSTFETYCRIIGLNPSKESQLQSLQNSQSQYKVIKRIRELDPNNALPEFLFQHLTGNNLKQMMSDFQNGQTVNVSFLARCIRHVFAHGILAANSTQLSPKRFNQISQVISDFLLNCMDQDFDNRTPQTT
ncbi:hypothetical protein [Adonisia turfae]|nr:hypothetical protein [Adonisia turfae]